jgi:hypothetical protein
MGRNSLFTLPPLVDFPVSGEKPSVWCLGEFISSPAGEERVDGEAVAGFVQ